MNCKSKPTLTLGYNLDAWNDYGVKIPVTVDISPATNSHMSLSGMSGSGKSFAEMGYISKLFLAQGGDFYFADYKGEDMFAPLRQCPRYWSFKQTLEALDIVYSRFNARLSGEDETRNQITLVWDEYMANILALQGEDKDKKPAERLAPSVMNKVSEILLMGRSMGVRLITSMPRPDAIAYPAGARLNYGVVVILGAYIRSIYEMMMPDHLEQVKGRQFGRGEGVALLQGSELHFIKIGLPQNPSRMQELCIQALS